jgi:hypothetical protein
MEKSVVLLSSPSTPSAGILEVEAAGILARRQNPLIFPSYLISLSILLCDMPGAVIPIWADSGTIDLLPFVGASNLIRFHLLVLDILHGTEIDSI